jgi:hypothetical protein
MILGQHERASEAFTAEDERLKWANEEKLLSESFIIIIK